MPGVIKVDVTEWLTPYEKQCYDIIEGKIADLKARHVKLMKERRALRDNALHRKYNNRKPEDVQTHAGR